ncbi:MAG: hypothetical protein J7M18_07260 [Candidatus Eremiobacteraeota bacterium]|nr:hypothetical protein [Candidatus Eremiobacteraeota bacterium]
MGNIEKNYNETGKKNRADRHTDRSMGRQKRIVLPEVWINEINPDYLKFWRVNDP